MSQFSGPSADSGRLAVFARLASRPIPRVLRMEGIARDLGYRTIFCGARREPGLSLEDEWQGVRIHRLGPQFPLLGGRNVGLYVRSVALFNFALFRFLRRTRPALLHASDIETMPAAILYRAIYRTKLIYNIHDNFAQRYVIPAWIRSLLNLVEGICVRLSHVTIVPEEFRRRALPSWSQWKVKVVRNTPGDIAYCPPSKSPDGRIRIFYGGWLDWGRGIRQLLELASEQPRIELRLAGEGAPEIVAQISAHPSATYLGFLDHREVLEETRRSHVIAAMYDPARLINRYAASNKIAEALAIGRPILINSELEVATLFTNSPCAIITAYSDTQSAWQEIEQLLSNWSTYIAACVSARNLFEEHYAWAPVRNAITSVIKTE